MIADALIVMTLTVILIYALIHLSEEGWGTGIDLINTNTWLTMIGASAYAYEGIGIILPLLDVTEKPELYPRILTYVFLTVIALYLGFGGFCLFVYGDKIDKPLITDNLPPGPIVYVTKVLFAC
jgi:solute carrier family 36 (proton-coupled amino acid transporter)